MMAWKYLEKCLTFLLQVRRNLKFPPVATYPTSPFHVMTGRRGSHTSRFKQTYVQTMALHLHIHPIFGQPTRLSCRQAKKKKDRNGKKRRSQNKIGNYTSAQRLKIQMKISHQPTTCSRNCLSC